MARPSQHNADKRAKERARQQRQKEKQARRLAAKENAEKLGLESKGEDPDLQGIEPGPQPLPDEWNYGPDDMPEEEGE